MEVFIFKACTVSTLLREIFIAIKTNVPPDVHAYQKIIARHIRRQHEVLVNLLYQLRQIGLLQFPFQDQGTVNRRCGEMNIYCPQAAIILQATTLHNIVALRIGSTKMPLKANIL